MALQLSGDIAGLGKIVQIVRATDSSLRSTTSTSYIDVPGMSVTITPQKADSTLLIVALFRCSLQGGTYNYGQFSITDASNNAISGGETLMNGHYNNTTFWGHISAIGYASPATTSAVSYKLRFKTEPGTAATVRVENSSVTGQMFAIEVAA